MRFISSPGHPDGDVQSRLTRAVLQEVAAGRSPETLRLYRPGRIVAFGRRDTLVPGYQQAVAEARAHGYQPVVRAAGGRAAVFHPGTIAFAWACPIPEPRSEITARFEWVSQVVARALAELGVDARVGEVAGEYCPGAFSVNGAGRHKLMGVGQRLIPGAAHVGGVIVVDDAAETRRILEAVYEPLGIAWNPATVGALSMYADVSWAQAHQAVRKSWESDKPLEPGQLSQREWEIAQGGLE